MFSVGRHTYYGSDLEIRTWKATEQVIIGSFCSIASEVLIHAGGIHRSDFASTFPFQQVMFKTTGTDPINKTTRPTIIGNDVWICDRVTILGGVRVGHGAIVAAGSVVFERVPPYAVVAGNPAEVRWYRFDKDTIRRMLKIAWWDWTDEVIRQNAEWFYKPARQFVDQFDR